MKKLEVTQLGNPVLRGKKRKLMVKEIQSSTIQALIKNMFHTVRKVHGVGLAAPQVGENIQLAVIDIQETPTRRNRKPFPKKVIINPRIIKSSSKKNSDWEGCLSFNTIRGTVKRPTEITVEYYDEHAQKHTETVTGFPARVFQHEIDHLNGHVFVDRMENMESLMTLDEYCDRVLD